MVSGSPPRKDASKRLPGTAKTPTPAEMRKCVVPFRWCASVSDATEGEGEGEAGGATDGAAVPATGASSGESRRAEVAWAGIAARHSARSSEERIMRGLVERGLCLPRGAAQVIFSHSNHTGWLALYHSSTWRMSACFSFGNTFSSTRSQCTRMESPSYSSA